MILMMHAMMGAAAVPPASGSDVDPSAFIFTIRVENDGDSFTWPHLSGAVYDAMFDWGDGSSDHVTSEPSAHVYATAGDYDVSVTGVCARPQPTSGSDWRAMLIAVKQWGSSISTNSWSGVFAHLSNELSIQALDSFGAGVVSTQEMFASTDLVGDISGWDMSNNTNMDAMFQGSSFSGDISGWDVSNVTSMNAMFLNAHSFNQDLSGWCVQNIASEPMGFAVGSALQAGYYPVWGSCP